MKLLIISDSHGNIANLKQVVGFGQKVGVKAVIHCGDWDNVESVETVLSFGIPLYTVLGNADVEEGLEEYIRFNAKKFDPNFLKFELDGRKIGVIHKIKNLESGISNLDIVFSGHYHSKEEKIINFLKFVRPGAVINGNNFAVYETINGNIEFIEDDQV